MLIAICMMAVMIGCKQKGQTVPADSKDSVSAVIDSIIEENDTTPMPMFLMAEDGQYMQMLYWTGLEEPRKTEDNADWFDESHRIWAQQDMFRRNKTQYTNMLLDDKFVKIKYIDEILKDPDGNTPSVGERHRKEIPSLCARFDFVDPKEKKTNEYGYIEYGTVIVTDSYLKTRKLLPIVFDGSEWDDPKPLPETAIKLLQQKYGMEIGRMRLVATIGGRYIWGFLQFKGEYKNAPKDGFYKDSKVALALDVLIDGDKVYAHEELGMYDDEYGPGWNADDGGEYVGCYPMAAFDGPKGLEICYGRDAPESSAVGMFFLRGGQLIQLTYETYHNMIDEQIPVWKKDFAEMQRLYLENDPHGHKDVHLTKWAHCYIDYDNEWIWLRDKEDMNGAFYIRKDGKLTLIDVENAHQKPSVCEKEGVHYLKFSGTAGGPSWQQIIYAFKDGKQLWKLFALEVYGELSECELNGREISEDLGKSYLEKVPEGKEITAYFDDIEEKQE